MRIEFVVTQSELTAIRKYADFIRTMTDPCRKCEDCGTCCGCPRANDYAMRKKATLHNLKLDEEMLKETAVKSYVSAYNEFCDAELAVKAAERRMDESREAFQSAQSAFTIKEESE